MVRDEIKSIENINISKEHRFADSGFMLHPIPKFCSIVSSFLISIFNTDEHHKEAKIKARK